MFHCKRNDVLACPKCVVFPEEKGIVVLEVAAIKRFEALNLLQDVLVRSRQEVLA